MPVEVLFENLADGLSLDDIVDSYDTLDRADCQAVLGAACELTRKAALSTAPTAADRVPPDCGEVVCDPDVMSGDPVVSGTRVPAATVVAYLRAGHSDRDIHDDYPTLQTGAVDAVRRWAERTYGEGWLKLEERGPPAGPAARRSPRS